MEPNVREENHPVPDVSGDAQEQAGAASEGNAFFTRKKIVVASSALALLAVGIVSYILIMNYLNHKELVKAYMAEYKLLADESDSFKKTLEAGPEDNKNTKDVISFYENLQTRNQFKTRLDEMNNKPEYASLVKEKQELSALGLDHAAQELDGLLADIDQLQAVVRKSNNADVEINLMETSTMTIGDTEEKLEELIKSNTALKDELAGMVLSPKLKQAQETFTAALSLKGKYLSENKTSNAAYLSYKVSMSMAESRLEEVDSYANSALSASFTSTFEMYKKWAIEANEEARKELDNATEKYDQSVAHRKEALKSLQAYVDVMQVEMDVKSFAREEEEEAPPSGEEVA